MNPLRFTRRNLLRGGLAATATVPLLDAQRAAGQTMTYPTRLVVFLTPNGTRNALYWPTGTETNFKDSYLFNVAGYRLAHLLGLNVPVSVHRKVDGKDAAVTWWVACLAVLTCSFS